jgi:hypothetical protein
MDFLRLLGVFGGSLVVVTALGAVAVVPSICEPVTSELFPQLVVGYNCLGLGEASQMEWAGLLGGAVAGLITIGTYLKRPSA